ncbi:MAG: MBL fold metallo-hydrolase [Alloprevotella sp.]|nr:MBL fold metallo-hydrolase [Alloprevotella sp.]
MLAAEGYNVTNLEGGILAWKDKGKPTSQVHVDAFVTPEGTTVRFYALMHASIRIVHDGRELQIDPVRQLGPRITDYTTMPKADYVLVTHEHPDHFDLEAIKLLSGNGTQLITNGRCAEMVNDAQTKEQASRENSPISVVSMKNGERLTPYEGFTVEVVPAYNTTEGRTQFHPKGRDNGYVLTIDGLRIYIAGDTEDIPEMARMGTIDVAFLPCNQPYTMTAEQLVRAARMVKPRVLFPYHFGQTDVSGLPAQLGGDGIDVRLRHYE